MVEQEPQTDEDKMVVTTGKITKTAKEKFDKLDIAWSENVTENMFLESETPEEG